MTIIEGAKRFLFQIVTDLIIAGSTNQNIANMMFTMTIIAWLLIGSLPCMAASLWQLLYFISLTIALGLFDCQAIIQLSLTHQWSWIHESKSRTIQLVCLSVVTILIFLTVGPELLQVCFHQQKF